MIRAQLEHDGDGIRLEVEGHAGAGSRGNDIVCAGASILCFALEAAIVKDIEADRMDAEPAMDIAEGYFCIESRLYGLDDEQRRTLEAYYRSAWAGLELLARQYPRRVSCEQYGKNIFG